MKTQIFTYFFYGATALILSLGLTPLIRILAFRINTLDQGDKGRKIHVGAIPRLGGVAIFISFALPFVFSLSRGDWDEFHRQMVLIMTAALMVFIIGVWDDIKGASIVSRLLVEFSAAFLVYASGIRIDFITNPFGEPLALGWLSLPVTLLWIVVITNAINLIDGLDGLAAGTGIMVILTMVLLNWGNPDLHVALTLFTLLGALLGFLVYNFPPASIFMGDSGSLFLGFFLVSFSIKAGFKASATAAMMVPIIAFSVPLVDMIYAILRRWHRGLPLGAADREHIHHKLLEKGMGRKKVLLVFFGAYFLILMAVLIFIQAKIKLDLVYLILIFVLAVSGLRLLGYIRFHDFLKSNYRHFFITRRRRYFYYLIMRFQKAVNLKKQWPDFHYQLDKLFREYNFSKVCIEIKFLDGMRPVYEFHDWKEEQDFLRLEFPLVQGGTCYGRVTIHKKLGDEYFLCISELTQTLSHSFSCIVMHYPDLDKIDWNLKNEDSGAINFSVDQSMGFPDN
ncbi:MAG: undecaprenyl/decaprenyl-phosphate alpha-N-acetylglucosaminyl 1-phosphate transferase [Candidatus Aminicenantes bacterium]|nr:undecaprenyl/decaprenyl-phosphate alpha-N-acetylglucosaminyl 1-phosphate transferase [Candidatus Aminicenantes bacterium]